MLTLCITPYRDGTWQWTGSRYTTADDASQVTPFQHPMIEHLAVDDGRRSLIVVRERVADRAVCDPAVRRISAAAYDEARAALVRWPVDYVAVETIRDEPARVTAGPCRTTPLYLAYDGASLYGSWDMADLRAHARRINVREAARLLLYRPRYSHDTLFENVYRLTERSTAHFGGHLYLRYPAPALHTGPRKLAPGADVLGAFVQALDDALNVRPLDAGRTVFHLTGGFDSGTAAMRAAQRHPGELATAALLISGPGRAQQVRRCKQLRAAVPFGPRDDVIDAAVEFPLHPACARVRGEPISPYEEPLHHPFTVMAAQVAEHGAHTVVTGLGGDEMVALSQAEHPHRASGRMEDAEGLPWIGRRVAEVADFHDTGIAPPAAVNSMTLLALETTAPVLLRAGLWPLHPFADPAMVALGEALPLDWRALKQLQRRQLAALGLGHDVVWPTEREVLRRSRRHRPDHPRQTAAGAHAAHRLAPVRHRPDRPRRPGTWPSGPGARPLRGAAGLPTDRGHPPAPGRHGVPLTGRPTRTLGQGRHRTVEAVLQVLDALSATPQQVHGPARLLHRVHQREALTLVVGDQPLEPAAAAHPQLALPRGAVHRPQRDQRPRLRRPHQRIGDRGVQVQRGLGQLLLTPGHRRRRLGHRRTAHRLPVGFQHPRRPVPGTSQGSHLLHIRPPVRQPALLQPRGARQDDPHDMLVVIRAGWSNRELHAPSSRHIIPPTLAHTPCLSGPVPLARSPNWLRARGTGRPP